jgi:hypothetical protein
MYKVITLVLFGFSVGVAQAATNQPEIDDSITIQPGQKYTQEEGGYINYLLRPDSIIPLSNELYIKFACDTLLESINVWTKYFESRVQQYSLYNDMVRLEWDGYYESLQYAKLLYVVKNCPIPPGN